MTWLEELEGVPQSDPKTEHYIGMPTLYRFTQKDGSEFYLIFEEGKNYNLVLQIQNSESCYTISEEQRAPWLEPGQRISAADRILIALGFGLAKTEGGFAGSGLGCREGR